MTGATLVIQATSSPLVRTRGRHRKRTSGRWISYSKRIASACLALSLALLALVFGAAVKLTEEAHAPAAQGAPTVAPPRATPLRAKPVSAPPVLFATDERGFVNSGARCEGTQRAVALGRTERSFVVICGDGNGAYQYRGVRRSDAALLTATAQAAQTHGYVARHAGVTYAVSPTELVVTTGRAVIKQEPMLEYLEQPK